MSFFIKSYPTKNLRLVLAFFFWMLNLLFMSVSVQAETIRLTENQKMLRNIQTDFRVFEDFENRSFAEIKALPDSVFSANRYNTIQHTKAAYWLKFQLKNTLNEAQHRVINFNDPDFESIDFYMDSKHYSAGTQYVFSSRPITHKNFVFNLNFEPRESKTVYVRLHSRFHASFTTDLSTTSELMSYSLTEYLLLGIFYGVIFILCVYNIILFFTDRNRTYLFYVFYILSCALFALNEDGLGFQFLWKNWPFVNELVYHLAPLSLLFSYLLYATSFTSLQKYTPRFSNYVWLSFVLFLGYYVLHTLFFRANPFWFFFYIIPYGLCYFFTLKLPKAHQRTTMFFLAGNTIIILSFLVYLFRLLNWVPSGILPVYSFNFAFITEAVVLSMAVGQQVKSNIKSRELAQKALIKGLEENEKLKDKVNRELEEKVSQRTKDLQTKSGELEKANQQLKQLQGELYHMNEALDKANFQLKKEVQQSTREMIKAKELSFEAFSEIFPNKRSCLEFIHKAKWELRSFVCKKCGSSEYKEKQELDRICAKCNTPHSVTSDTLFHAVKLDLQKALYLAYLINRSPDKYTVDQLAEKVAISRNAAWNFKKKVVTQKTEIQKSTKTERVDLERLVVG